MDYEIVSSHYADTLESFKDSRPRNLEELYVKGSLLGEGRFAVVKSAKHQTPGKEYALKVINKAKVFGREDIRSRE